LRPVRLLLLVGVAVLSGMAATAVSAHRAEKDNGCNRSRCFLVRDQVVSRDASYFKSGYRQAYRAMAST
jgi:hypothetical protein